MEAAVSNWVDCGHSQQQWTVEKDIPNTSRTVQQQLQRERETEGWDEFLILSF